MNLQEINSIISKINNKVYSKGFVNHGQRVKTYVEDAAGEVPIANLDIDGGTDIGADLTQSDLIMVDDGAGGTNRKAALSRVVTLINANIDDPTALSIALG